MASGPDPSAAETIVRRFIDEVWNHDNAVSAEQLVAPDCPGLEGRGPVAVLAWHQDRRAAFPDLRYEVVDIVCAPPSVTVRWSATGTHRGHFGPVPPTGRSVTYAGASFLRLDEAGRIADVWSVNELFQLLQQLGVTVTPPSPPEPG